MVSADAPGIDRAPLSKPLQARLILTGTAGVILGILALWLFAWVIARKPGGLWTAWVDHREPTAPVLAFQREDVNRLGGGSARALEARALESALETALARSGSAAPALYLSAPGVSLGGRTIFLPAEAIPLTAEGGGDPAALSAEALADRLAAAQGRRVLLILDAGQVGTDRSLGVFGNGFIATLAARLREKGTRNVVVLSSCAPGQVSHVSEADRRSVFAEFVARGLAGEAAAWDSSGRLTVHGLARYVREHVERWVETHHQSVQTPVLLGDAGANFSLRPIRPGPAPEPSAGEESSKALDALEAAWKTRDEVASWRPERHSPILWERYLDALLRAERLLRAGRFEELNEGLVQASRLVETLRDRRDGWPRGRCWSLAEAERAAHLLDGPAAREAEKPITAARKAIAAATDRITGRIPPTPETAPAAEAPAKDAAPAPSTPAQASGSQGTETPEQAKQLPSLTGLVDAGREEIPTFLEAQPLVWVIRYARRPGSSSFRGARGELLRDLLTMQAVAERAAARDDRLWKRLDSLRRIDAERRRPALDGLFARDDGDLETARRGVGEATRAYEEWDRAAQDAAAALDLRDRVQAEWPYYGEWLARRGQAHGPEFQALREQSISLAEALGRDQPEPADDAARIVAALGRSWDALEAEAHTAAEQARTSGARWRELDDLLTLPFLPADLRRALLERLLSAEVAGSLDGEPAAGPAGAGESEALENGPADARFWPRAVSQAEVELTVLRMGGASGPNLDTLRLALESARNARDETAATAEALAQFSARVPAARAELLSRARGASNGAAAREEDDQAAADLIAADRAARSLPASWTHSFVAEATPAAFLDRWNRYRQLLDAANRLLDDFAADHAGLVLAEARSLGSTRDLREALERAGKLAGARLAVSTEPAGAMTLADQAAELKVVARPEGLLPEGRGAVLLGLDPGQPISVRRAEPEAAGPASEGGGSGSVHIAGAESDTVRYLVDRTEYTPDALAIELAPEVFYRGHSFPAGRPLRVALDPAREAVTITLEDPNPRGFRDQYLDHPGRGFLHYNAGLGYRLGLRNNTEAPLSVWVSAILDGQTSPPRSLTIAPGKPDTSLGGHLQAVDLPPPKPDAPAPPPGPDEVPLGRSRTLTVEVREKNESGRPLANVRRYVFEQLPVEQYAAATTHFSPNDGRVYVVVHHLAADRVNGPVNFLVTVAGMSQRVQVQKGQSYTTWFSILPPWPEKVRYSVQVGDKPNAFSGEVSTGLSAAPPEPKPAAAPPAGSP